MKEWICWVLLVIGVLSIIFLGWWLTTIFDTMTIYYITVALNSIVSGYLYFQKNNAKNYNHGKETCFPPVALNSFIMEFLISFFQSGPDLLSSPILFPFS